MKVSFPNMGNSWPAFKLPNNYPFKRLHFNDLVTTQKRNIIKILMNQDIEVKDKKFIS